MKNKDKQKIKATRKAKFTSALINTWIVGTGVLCCQLIIFAALHNKFADNKNQSKYSVEQTEETNNKKLPSLADVVISERQEEPLLYRKNLIEQELGVYLSDYPGSYKSHSVPNPSNFNNGVLLSNEEYERRCRNLDLQYLKYMKRYTEQFDKYCIDKNYFKQEGYEEVRKQISDTNSDMDSDSNDFTVDRIPSGMEVSNMIHYGKPVDEKALRKGRIEQELGVELYDKLGDYYAPAQGPLTDNAYANQLAEYEEWYNEYQNEYYKQLSMYCIDEDYNKLPGYSMVKKIRDLR